MMAVRIVGLVIMMMLILVGSQDDIEDGEEIDLVTKNAMMVMAMLKKIMIIVMEIETW